MTKQEGNGKAQSCSTKNDHFMTYQVDLAVENEREKSAAITHGCAIIDRIKSE